MKNYFNRPDTNVFLMIDSESDNVFFVNNATKMKNIIVMTDIDSYTIYSNEIGDVSKWVSSDEETFNSVVTTIKSMI